jgi:TonB family protein
VYGTFEQSANGGAPGSLLFAKEFVMWKLALIAMGFAACASGTRALDLETAQRAGARLDLTATAVDGAMAITPSAKSPRLPSADRIARRIRFELGDTAQAKVEMCITPEGRVARVALLESSKLAAFDQALLRDTAEWQFAALPGPSTIEHCRAMKISYRAW